jgi:hypothetical protein
MKIVFISGIICLLSFSVASAVQRMVVGEYFTNVTPSYAYYWADGSVDTIIQAYGDSLAVIRYHVWWGLDPNDPFYLYNTHEIGIRNSYLSNTYYPHLFLDGTIDADGIIFGNDVGIWSDSIDNELQRSSPLIINLAGAFDSTSRNGMLNVTIIAVDSIAYSNLKLRIAITESNINYHGHMQNQTFRDMVPDASGIPVSIIRGDTLYFSQSFSCPAPLVPLNCELVAFVQSDNGRRILQGAKIRVSDMIYMLTSFDLISPTNHDTLETLGPSFVWHQCNDPDSGFAINYRVLLSTTPSFADTFAVSSNLSDTAWSEAPDFPNFSTHYWKVIASNGHARDRESSQHFTFFFHEPCSYVVGDANGSNTFTGLDVTYSVRYFKGGPSPSYSCECTPGNTWFVTGDVNGSCSFSGLDVTYMVRYFKSGPGPIPCGDCPPAHDYKK